MQPRDELGLRHAADLEIEAQQIGIDQRRQRGDVVREQRLAKLRLDLVAVDHAAMLARYSAASCGSCCKSKNSLLSQ